MKTPNTSVVLFLTFLTSLFLASCKTGSTAVKTDKEDVPVLILATEMVQAPNMLCDSVECTVTPHDIWVKSFSILNSCSQSKLCSNGLVGVNCQLEYSNNSGGSSTISYQDLNMENSPVVTVDPSNFALSDCFKLDGSGTARIKFNIPNKGNVILGLKKNKPEKGLDIKVVLTDTKPKEEDEDFRSKSFAPGQGGGNGQQ